MNQAQELQARGIARTLKKRLRDRAGARGRVRDATGKDGPMTISAYRVGDYVISIDYDEALRSFGAVVTNRGYAVRLSAPSAEELNTKVERLLTNYLGAHAA